MSIIKNQHFVPRVYLEKFTYNGVQLHVFDKSASRSFPSSVKNVACEKFFYDIPEKYIQDSQAVEKYLSGLEGRFAECRNTLLSEIETTGRVSQLLKEEFVEFLILQMLRTKTQRERIVESDDKIQSVMKSNPALADSHKLHEDMIGLQHANTMFSPLFIVPFKQILLSHIWVMGVNQTTTSFYTSDSPVVRYPHIKDPLRGTNGIGCLGVEIDFPLSPKYILILAERTYHDHMTRWEDGIFPLADVSGVEFINQLQVHDAYRQVYCDQNDFTVAIELLKRAPHLANIDRPRIELVSPPLRREKGSF